MDESDVLGIFGGLLVASIFICMLAVAIVLIAALWKVFVKAGQPGWAAIVPIYSTVVLLQIVGRPIWWILLMFIPLVNLVIVFLLYMDLAKSFGKDTAFAIGLFFLAFIFFPILGFGSARYLGPAAAAAYLPPPPPAGPGIVQYPPSQGGGTTPYR